MAKGLPPSTPSSIGTLICCWWKLLCLQPSNAPVLIGGLDASNLIGERQMIGFLGTSGRSSQQQYAIDPLTTMSLIFCYNHEQLWFANS